MLNDLESPMPIETPARKSSLTIRDVAIVSGAGLGMFINLGTIILYTFGVFLKPIVGEMGWQRAVIVGAFGPATLAAGLVAPFAGALIDRFGVRRFVFAASLAFAAGLCLLGLYPHTQNEYVVCLIIAVISGAGLTPLPFSYVVTEAFDRRRGLALGVVLTISAAAVAILPPVAAQVIDRFGWREAYVMLGIFVLVGGVFIATVLFRSLRAKTRALRSSVALMPAASVPGVTYGKALRSPIFWLLLASLFLASFCVSAGTIPLPAVLSDRGVPPTRAALAFSIIGISMGITRLTVGALLDYLRAPKLTAALLLAPIVGHVLLAQGTAGGEVVVAAACFGIGLGVELDAYAYMVSRAFGVANFGKIYGTVLIAFTAGIATGPSIVSSVFVDTGGFNPGFLAMGAAGVLAAALLFFVKPSAFPYAARGHAPATK